MDICAGAVFNVGLPKWAGGLDIGAKGVELKLKAKANGTWRCLLIGVRLDENMLLETALKGGLVCACIVNVHSEVNFE